MKTDSWKRPLEVSPEPAPKPKPHVNNYVEATPEEVAAWRQEDYWNRGDYDPMKMFVVIPAIIQMCCLAMMGGVMLLASYVFG